MNFNKKGGMEMSINLIIIIIIALTVLGLVLGFVVTKFNDMGNKVSLNEDTPEPSYSQQITFPGGRTELHVKKNKPLGMVVKIYNTGDTTSLSTGDSSATLILSCVPNSANNFKIDFANETGLNGGSITSIPIEVKATQVKIGEYSCLFKVKDTTTTFASRPVKIIVE